MDFERKVYICQNKSEQIRMDSTSGGVFSVLSKYILDRNGVIFGAKFDESYRVVHDVCEKYDDLFMFRGSKYVQSHLGESFKKVKKYLTENRWVLFTGTPCQIAGLKSFLKVDYEKLILMDIVCYSISSPKVWKMYLEHLRKTKNIDLNKINKIKFRDKSKYGYEYTLMSFYDSYGNKLFASGPESNQMLRSFTSNTATRPSCYKCRFKIVERVSDFTVWDCYNVYQYNRKMDDNKGTSYVIIHTSKALKVFEEIKRYMNFEQVELDAAVKSEPAMTKCSIPSDIRKDFFAAVIDNKDPFELFFHDYIGVKVERTMRSLLSNIGIYKYIKRILKEMVKIWQITNMKR